MKKIQCFFSVIVAIMICSWSTFVCSASENKRANDEGILLVVVDQSKETYGAELKDVVYNQLKNQVKGFVNEESTLHDMNSKNADEIAKAEQAELLELANEKGVKQVLIVEILPIKSDFSDIILYKSIKSEATLRIRLYDRTTKQYMLNEAVSALDTNKTYIPYTGVKKKVTVLTAVHKATDIVGEKVNQNVLSVNK